MFDDDLRPYTGILHAPEVVREWLKDMKLPPLLEPRTIERTAWNGPEQHGEVEKLVERKRKKRRHDRGSIDTLKKSSIDARSVSVSKNRSVLLPAKLRLSTSAGNSDSDM